MAESSFELFEARSPPVTTENQCFSDDNDNNKSSSCLDDHSASLDDVEADTPLEQRLLVDQDLFREKNNNLKTYTRRRGKMSKKCLKIQLQRCDVDEYTDVAAVPLQEISLDETSPRGNGRTRRSKIQESPSPKKRRVSVNDSNDENVSGLASTARMTRRKSCTDVKSPGPDLQTSPVKTKPEEQLQESSVLMSEESKSTSKSPDKKRPTLAQKSRSTRSSTRLSIVAESSLIKQEPDDTCLHTNKSPSKDQMDKPAEENTPENSVFKTPIFPTSITQSMSSSTFSFADMTCSSAELDCSSDDDTSWNDSLECLELPNQLLMDVEDHLTSIKEEVGASTEDIKSDVLKQELDMSVGSDSPLDASSDTSDEAEEEFEFKKGAPVLAKVGSWPHWPAFVVPFHGSYRMVKNQRVLFHVVFCGHNHERSWVYIKNLLPFINFEDCLVKYTSNKKEPNTLNVPKKMYGKFQTAVADMLLYRDNSKAYVEEYEVKLPPPKPSAVELKALVAMEKQKSKQERLHENEIRRLKKIEDRDQQRKERDLIRKAKEEARAQISRNVCLQCHNHEDKSTEMKCSQCDFSFHLSCQGVTEPPAASAFVCSFCREQNMPCFVCFKHTQGAMLKCKVAKCNKWYHPTCLGEHWQQATFDTSKQQLVSCPTHSCHTCIHRDLVSFKKIIDSRDKLVRCIKCPGTYHKDPECIPAAAIKINSHQIICPRHTDLEHKPRTVLCQICCTTFPREIADPDSIRACRICPCTYHTKCLDEDDLAVAREEFLCVNCSDGFFPKVNDIVWAKLGSSRWWPAKVIPHEDISEALMQHKHKEGQFVVKFYGTDNFSWISNKCTFHIQDQTDVHHYSAVSIKDVKFMEGVTTALGELSELELNWDRKVGLYYHTQNEKKPANFRRIKNNIYVPPCKPCKVQFCDLGMCRCKPTDPDPCGESCENRLLGCECSKDCQCGEKCQNQCMQRFTNAPTELCHMGGKGWGLLAKEDLKQGTFVIEYVGEVVTKEEFNLRRAAYVKNNEAHFYFLQLSAHHYIDAKSKGNDSRFINHSCQPNCKSVQWYVNSIRRIGLFTLVDVKAGEELTFDYNWERDQGCIQKCLCGTEACQNFLAAEKNRHARKSVATPKPAKEVLDNDVSTDVSKGTICDVCSGAKSRNSTICSSCYENQEY